MRGEGDVLGTRQSGMPGFRIARSEIHTQLITQARDEALRCLLYLYERDEAIPLIGAG